MRVFPLKIKVVFVDGSCMYSPKDQFLSPEIGAGDEFGYIRSIRKSGKVEPFSVSPKNIITTIDLTQI